MGSACGKTTEENQSRTIDKQLFKAQRKEEALLKVLLLGTGESGKSTIFKQARTLYGRGYSETDRMRYKVLVYKNILTQMKAIIMYRRNENLTLQEEGNTKLEDILLEQAKQRKIENLSPEVYEALRALWTDSAIQKCWKQKSSFQVYDSLEYFLNQDVLDRVEKLGAKYIPTFEDCLQVRTKTAGVVVESLTMNRTKLEMYDVGGQRTERDKWIDCFDNVTTVMFVAAINEYDQTLYEANAVNRMVESLEVWSKIVNRPEFKNVTFVLFLNKYDLFAKKVCEIPYRLEGVRNEDYTGKDPMSFTNGSKEQEAAIEECLEHSRNLFLKLVDSQGRTKSINSFKTVAINNEYMTNIFRTCQSSVLEALITTTL